MPKSVKNALRNSFFQTFGSFFITGLNFVLMLGYARFLGPASLGELVTAQAHVLVWLAFVDLGLTNALISALTAAESGKGDLARQGFRARDIVVRVFFMRLLGAALGIMLLVLSAYFRNRVGGVLDISAFLRDIAFAPHLLALAFQHTAVAYAMFRGRQGLGMVAMLISTAVTVMLPLYLAFRGSALSLLLVAQCWGGFLSSLIIAIVFWLDPMRRDSRRQPKAPVVVGSWAGEAWRALFRDAWPYALAYAVVVLWQRLDQIVASEYLGYEQAGQYALAVRLAAVPILMSTSVSLALFPDLQRVGIDAPKKISIYMGAITKFVFRYGIVLIGALLLFIYLVITPFVPKFASAMQLLPWFLPGIWMYWLQSFVVGGLYAVRAYHAVISGHVFAILVYVIVLVPLTKICGLVGVVIASNLFPLVLFVFTYQVALRRQILHRKYSVLSRYTQNEMELLDTIQEKLAHLMQGFRRQKTKSR